MEILLRWADDLDDVLGVARHLAPRALAWFAAVAGLAGVGCALALGAEAALAMML
ncbi:MAG TPA: hypothetical protein VK025_09265 [Steroidobacter sp.]|jgi:hypothetical protein|nr:hypothetical protein [Steroidobacteraceae bacterium]HLS81575.1 hypothetical protein [Steroidobacter sp.]